MAGRVRAFASELIEGALGGGRFMLVELDKDGSPVPVYDRDGEILKFEDGKSAALKAREMSDERGTKVQPRPINDDRWQEREEKRLADGTYAPLPWAHERWWGDLKHVWKDHYVHVSLKNGAAIAFTESMSKGVMDVQTRMKPGKYLERFFGKLLTPFVIRDLVVAFAAKYEDNVLMFAEQPEEMEEVYIEGPNSCMSKTKDAYKTPVHPVRAYAAGDLAIAYIKRDGKIAARAVVWPEKKMYSTIYGDGGRLAPILQKQGYKNQTPFGAKLAKIKRSTTAGRYVFVVPHLDNSGWVKDEGGEFLTIGQGNMPEDAIQVASGAGVTEECGWVCATPDCGKNMTARSLKQVWGKDKSKPAVVCMSCLKKAKRCCMTGNHIQDEYATPVEGAKDRFIWTAVLGQYAFMCPGDSKYHLNSEGIGMPNGQMWSRAHFKKAGKTCSDCGNVMRKEEECQCGKMHAKHTRTTKEQQFIGVTGSGTGTVGRSTTWVPLPTAHRYR